MRVGDSIKIITSHPNPLIKWVNELKTAGKGSGDKAYIYYPPYSFMAFVRGTIPLGEDSFKISGATTNGVGSFSNSFLKRMGQGGLDALNFKSTYSDLLQGYHNDYTTDTIFYTYLSPTLDSINYWFLKKSINLYGEAFVKTIAYEKTGFGSTDTGVAFIKDFWSKQGIEKSALNIIDGSGLSPANRVTTYALVAVMQYARKQTWFPSFYNALPEMNGLTMKDGYISGVRSYTGYVKNKTGAEYTFSFIVNNFDGSAATVREKIWKVLDILK